MLDFPLFRSVLRSGSAPDTAKSESVQTPAVPPTALQERPEEKPDLPMAGAGVTDGAALPAAALSDIARRTGDLSVSIADVAGAVQDVSGHAQRQSEGYRSIRDGMAHMAESGSSVVASASEAREVSAAADARITDMAGDLAAMVARVQELTGQVSSINTNIVSVASTLKQVARVSQHVAGIARQTNLLSLNAAVEAARAGENGRGFAVVAGEVKSLSNQASAATEEIGKTVAELSSVLSGVMSEIAEATGTADDLRARTATVGKDIQELPQSLSALRDQQEQILGSARDIDAAIAQTLQQVDALNAMVSESTVRLSGASENLLALTDNAETITGLTARLGVHTVDSPFIAAVQEGAARISELFAEAVRTGQISMEELFDTSYRPIPGSDPQQFTTRFVDFTDRVLPEIQEPMLDLDPTVIFCAAIDRNGYIPTHNHKFSAPQRAGDPVFNAANSRNRRKFEDRVGLSAGRSQRNFLLQAYRRDMGNGDFRMMKDVSAPIMVGGRHWGGLRLAYLAG